MAVWRWFGACVMVLSLWSFGAVAQDRNLFASPILTLDQERLFLESVLAKRLSAEIETLRDRLQVENLEIEEQLLAEELALTEQRPGMDPAAFRVLADAFDTKVQGIRAQQDAKALELGRMRDQERQNFLIEIAPVLQAIMRERGALVLLEKRATILSAGAIDITDDAIARINAELLRDPGVTPPQE